MPNSPYTVVKERYACKACSQGLLWTVQGPTGESGTSYELEEDAHEEATAINHAYALGYEAGRKED